MGTCQECCKGLCCVGINCLIFTVIASLWTFNYVIPGWFEKSNCSIASNECLCPQLNGFVPGSLFVGFDIGLSNDAALNMSEEGGDDINIILSKHFTRNDIHIGMNQTHNISFYANDFNLTDSSSNIFAYILIYDYPDTNTKERRYVHHYSFQLTKHKFIEVPGQSIHSKLQHIVYFAHKINLLYVVEYGCFSTNLRVNRILLPYLISKDSNNSLDSYSPIVLPILHDEMKQTLITDNKPITLSISFRPNSIFGFQFQRLMLMNNDEARKLERLSPEAVNSYRILSYVYFMNNVQSFDEIQNYFTEASVGLMSAVITFILGLISLRADYKFWTNPNLAMKNICCAAILIYSIIPLIYNQTPAYDWGFTKNIEQFQQQTGNEIDEYYLDFPKQFEEYFQTMRKEELIGVVIGFVSMLFMGLIVCGYYVIFPLVKAIKCFRLKTKEGVTNDVVATFEGLLVMISCIVIGMKPESFGYFLRYIGMGIFVPQIIINYCLDHKQSVPKLPLIVMWTAIMDQTCISLMRNYLKKNVEITKFDILYWCRDVLIVSVLYLQYRRNDKIKSKTD